MPNPFSEAIKPGSYSQEVVEVTCCNCNTFYIRAMNCQSLEKRIAEIKEEEWQRTEINHKGCWLASLSFTAFFAERGSEAPVGG